MNVYISRDEMTRMLAYAQACNDEIGGLAKARMIDGQMHITRVFISKQKVHGATCELDPEDLGRLEFEAREVQGDFIVWWHSHVNMGVSPSGQDDETFAQRIRESGRCLAMIVNKKGDVSARFGHSGTDMLPAMRVTAKVNVVDNTSFTSEDIEADIKRYVSKITHTNKNKYANYQKRLSFGNGNSMPKSVKARWRNITLKGMYYFETRGEFVHIVKRVNNSSWQLRDVCVTEYLDDYPKDINKTKLLSLFTEDNGKEYLGELEERESADDGSEMTELDMPLAMQWWEDCYKQSFGLKMTDFVDDADIESYFETCKAQDNMVYYEFKAAMKGMMQ